MNTILKKCYLVFLLPFFFAFFFSVSCSYYKICPKSDSLSHNSGCSFIITGVLILICDSGKIIEFQVPHCDIIEHNTGTLADLNAIESRINWNYAYIVGDSGKILKINALPSINWVFQNSNTTQNLNDVAFHRYLKKGYAAGDNGTVLKTTNQGTNWQVLTTGITKNLNNVSVFGGDTIVVFGDDLAGYRSTDGGNTWVQMSFIGEPDLYNPNSQGPDLVESFFFDSVYSNSLTGFVIGENYVFKTTNGGTNWFPRFLGAPYYGYTIYFSSPDTGMVAGEQGAVYYTTNGGGSWILSDSASSITNKTIRDFVIIDTNLAAVVGDSGLFIYVSTDSSILGIGNNYAGSARSFLLFQNYPNPFNPATNISYEIATKSYVKLSVYDINGRLIRILVNGTKNRGKYIVGFNAGDLSSGVYFYRIETKEVYSSERFTETKKMLLIK